MSEYTVTHAGCGHKHAPGTPCPVTAAEELVQRIADDAARFDADTDPQLFPYGIAHTRDLMGDMHQGVFDQDWKAATDAAARLVARAKFWEDYTIASMRVAGLTWSQIGDVLGMTRQAAWERWRWLDRVEPRPSAG